MVAADKIYDGNNSAIISSCDLVGLIGADAVNCLINDADFDDKHVGVGKTVTVHLSLFGADEENYEVETPATTSASISKLAITVTAKTDTKPYDGTTNSDKVPEITDRSLAPGDTATWTQSFDTPDVGTGKILTPNGVAHDGNPSEGANYEVTFVSDATGEITKADQTITFGPLPTEPLEDNFFTLSATASSGLEVTFTGGTAGVCTVDADGTVTLEHNGDCSVTAQQAGDDNYNAAPDLTITLKVSYVINEPASSLETTLDGAAADGAWLITEN